MLHSLLPSDSPTTMRTRGHRPRARCTAAGLIALAGWCLPATGATAADLHVPSASFPTIQSAVQAAQPGDRVVVAAGTYAERIDMQNRMITLTAPSGPQATTIHAGGIGPVIINPGTNAVIHGFTLAGGLGGYGGGIAITGTSPWVVDCVVLNNLATFGGGVSVRSGGAPMFIRCRFSDNTANFGGGVYLRDGSTGTFLDCVVQDNVTLTGTGAGVHVNLSTLAMRSCVIYRNDSITKSGGGIFASSSTTTLIDCTISTNLALENGGGLMTSAGSLSMVGCILENNHAQQGGGWYGYATAAHLVSSLFRWNSAAYGGGAFLLGAQPRLTNTTIADNWASGSGGGLRVVTAAPVLCNAILWGNYPDQVSRVQDGTTLSFSCIQGGWSGAGTGNISDNPQFVDALNGDHRLHASSPCINAGDSTALPGELAGLSDPQSLSALGLDLAGEARIMGSAVDHGAYELPDAGCRADLNDDGVVNFRDLLAVVRSFGPCDGCRADLTDDGVVSVWDLIALLSAWGACP